MNEITLEILDPRHDPEPACWEKLRTDAGQLAIWKYDLLQTFAWTERSPLLLTVIRDGPTPIGAVCCSLRELPPRLGTFAMPTARKVAGVIDVHSPGSRAQKGWWFTGVRGQSERKQILRCYLNEIRRELGLAWHGIVWREVSEEDQHVLPGLIRLPRPTYPVTRLPLSWPDTQGWYASLTKARRTDLRRQVRKVDAEAGLTARVGPSRELISGAELARLKQGNAIKYAKRLAPIELAPLPYLEKLVKCDEAVAITYRNDSDRLLAVSLVLDHPTWPLYHIWGGLPPEHGGRRHVYFDAYSRMVEWAIEAGKTGLIWGKGQADIKCDLGAEVVASSVVAVPH